MLWFSDLGRGKASLEQQLIGLGPLLDSVHGKIMLDVGCAEGLIALECQKRGAQVLGIESRPQAVAIANGLGVQVVQADAQTWQPAKMYDVVLLLGVVHKLVDPGGATLRFLRSARTAVLRLPPGMWPVLTDSRSGSIPVDLAGLAAECSMRVRQMEPGPAGQIVVYLS